MGCGNRGSFKLQLQFYLNDDSSLFFFPHVLLLFETNLLTRQKNLLSQDASFVFFLLADFSQTISFIVLRGKKKKKH